MDELDNIDDFLPLPGADVVVASDSTQNTVFTKPNSVDLTFLDTEEGSEDTNVTTTNDVLDEITNIEDETEDVEKATPGRKKTDKSGLVSFLKKRIEKGDMFTFDDYDESKQNLEEYLEGMTEKDLDELWSTNIETIKSDVAAKTPQEFFEALPEEMQKAARYIANGGTDLKGLFKTLAQVQEYKELDINTEDGQESIVRQYLYATNFGEGDRDLIEDQVAEWVETGLIGKKATQLKPKLDSMQEKIVEQKLAQQEEFRKQQEETKAKFLDNVYDTLNKTELNGLKLDGKRQKFLWDELTNVKYSSLRGTPTNLLGKLLEDYQFGEKPRYDLIAESLWLLSDPEDYKENIRKQVKAEVTTETVKKLKTEQANKTATTNAQEEEENTPRRKVSRPANIFTGKRSN